MSATSKSRARAVPEEVVWCAAGVLGALLPVVPAVLLAAIWFLPLGVAIVVGFGWLTQRARKLREPRAIRLWAGAAWALAAGAYYFLLIVIATPPGADLPPGQALVGQARAFAALWIVGSATIAVLAIRIARHAFSSRAPRVTSSNAD